MNRAKEFWLALRRVQGMGLGGFGRSQEGTVLILLWGWGWDWLGSEDMQRGCQCSLHTQYLQG